MLDEPAKALDYDTEAHRVAQASGGGLVITSLWDSAEVYASLGQKQKALDYLAQAVQESRSRANPGSQARGLTLIAQIHAKSGEDHQAIGYYTQALRFL